MERKFLWETYDENQLRNMNEVNERYKNCLNVGKTERECVTLATKMAQEAGYVDLKDVKEVKPGSKIQQAVDEQIADRIVRRLKADRNAGLIFVPAEFLCNGRLADTTCAFDKQRVFRRIFLFPFQHFRVNLALQNHFAH